MILKHIVSLFAAIAALPLVCRAQVPKENLLDPEHGLTVEQLVSLAATRNGDIAAGRYEVAAARGGVTQARLKANPMVEVNDSQQFTGSMNNFMIGGSIPLEMYHRRERRVDVALGNVGVAESEQAERERRLRGEVELKFGEALAAERSLRFTNEQLELSRKALALADARAAQGSIPPLDANLMRVEVDRMDASRTEYETRLEVSLLELKSLVGMKESETLTLNGALDSAPLPVGREEALRLVLEIRPDLQAARASERLAETKLKQARTEGRPDASITANYSRADSSFDLNGLDAAGQMRPIQGVFHFWSAGVSIALPVRNKNQGAIESAVAQVEAAKRRREYLELNATREVVSALVSLDKSQESVRIYRDKIRPQATQNLEVIRRVYELGRNQLSDVIAEQRRFVDVENGYTEALSRYYQAAVRLRVAAALP